MRVSRPLPGVRIDVAPPPPVEALPRMDVAIFVGFASTGPLHLPVAVESVTQYTAVFGPDAPLAWDSRRATRVRAYLGPAVRAFFANGGRRCWVIRVARMGTATTNQFPVPGVLELAGGQVSAAIADARCEGSWSDGLRLRSALAAHRFAIADVHAVSSPAGSYTLATRYRVAAGDLLELGVGRGQRVYAVVDAVRPVASSGAPIAANMHVVAAFEQVNANASPPLIVPSPAALASQTGLFTDVPVSMRPASETDDRLHVTFAAPVPASIERGNWVRIGHQGDRLWLRIEEITQRAAPAASVTGSAVALIEAEVVGRAWRQIPVPALASTVNSAAVLTLDLQAYETASEVHHLQALGLTPAQRNSWWGHESDRAFYGREARTPVLDGPRFPLASRAERLPDTLWLPLSVEPLFSVPVGPVPQAATALERDGLAQFDSSLFLDPDLASTRTATLVFQADAIRFVQESPRELLGLHAAMAIATGSSCNESSLICAPDAVHRGWRLRDVPPAAQPMPAPSERPAHWARHRGPCAVEPTTLADPDFGTFLDCTTRELPTPTLFGPTGPVKPSALRLSWSASERQSLYSLEESRQADFSAARVVAVVADTQLDVLIEQEGTYYYRVFATRDGERSDDSNAITVLVRADAWQMIDPEEFADDAERELLRVHRALLRLAAGTGELFGVVSLPHHFRAAAAIRYVTRLREVRSGRETFDSEALAFDEGRVLSYGAVYHPWLVSGARSATSSLIDVPPDGFVAGMLAARATARGAWVAPANEILKDAVALAPLIETENLQALQDAQINIVRNEARGFCVLCADTLAVDSEPELRPINVRRLLTLLRRLALRRGASYVFEPNGATLRRAVQRSFDILLSDMYRRGAFVGRTRDESFRVVTDARLSTDRERDGGRFIVELRIAPALPMQFLSVQLAQRGERLAVTEVL